MEKLNRLSYEIIGCAYEVHKQLGPGLLESTYEACLEYELIEKGLETKRQVALPVVYKDIKLDAGYRIDLLVQESIILEIKAAEAIIPIYEAQLLTYLKLSGIRLGLLINFNVKDLRKGIMRRVF
ncbi:MAG: GxxExxY protein [Salinivirgaceae bacterium]